MKTLGETKSYALMSNAQESSVFTRSWLSKYSNYNMFFHVKESFDLFTKELYPDCELKQLFYNVPPL